MTANKSDRIALLRLADALVEDVLNTPDDAILAEVREDHADPDAVTEARALFGRTVVAAGKSRLAAAKAALRARPTSATVIQIDPAEARRRLERILANEPDTVQKLTLAARKGRKLSDDDVISVLENMAELGIPFDPEGQ